MADLYLHGRKLESIFELLGTKENDITYSIGWALSQSPDFLDAALRHVFPKVQNAQADTILLQEHKKDGGFTDIEIIGPTLHTIIEAKRGWWLPNLSQLKLYCARFEIADRQNRCLVVMSECSREYAGLHLPKDVEGYPLTYFSWKDVDSISRIQNGTHAEKRLLSELRAYLRRIVKMQNQESNVVYVVSLGYDRPEWSKLSWIEIVTKKRRYFHPVERGWPKEPPNYFGFRYYGKLQSINHVDSWKIVEDLHKEIPEIDPGLWNPHFAYALGEPIIPLRTVKTGKIYGPGHKRAMIDLLLTCNTVSEACDLTQRRLSEAA